MSQTSNLQILLLLISCMLQQQVILGDNVHLLTAENFLSVTEGKNIFIKFYAPWCSKCRAMAEDWDRLGKDFKDHEHTIVGEVDCTSDTGKLLCEEYEVLSYPTLIYGDPINADTYDGDRDYDSMSAFAQEKLSKPICSVYNQDHCTKEEAKVIQSLMEMSKEDLEEVMTTVEDQVKAAEDDFDEQVTKIQEAYDALVMDYNSKLDSLKDAYNYHYMEQVLMLYHGNEAAEEEL
mmetsp:Transcript_26781/g.65124  ORF Transcript_26781/g.65124 Transcript_26781/m.65124 type:complete len:234 (-) Transcript_26781:3594-4295(-)